MKTARPSLWRFIPRVGWKKRLKYTAMAMAITFFAMTIFTWVHQARAQTAPATAPEAAAASAPASQPGVPTSTMPAYFAGNLDAKGIAIPDPIGANYGVWATPSGTYDTTKTGDASIAGDNPTSLSSTDLYNRIVHNEYAINFVWTLIEGMLVMFMQLGFAMVETGLCRAKNAGHTFAMNMMIYPLGMMGFFIYGFAIGWGNWFNGPAGPGWYASLGPGTAVLNYGWGPHLFGHDWTFIGLKGFCLFGVNDVGVLALFFFEMVFMDTTATIPTGTMAERWKWSAFVAYGLVVAFPYCLNACWLWGGGWLAQLGVNFGWGNGACDFAGSGVVHMMGGVIALAGGIAIGPRIGKYINGKAQAIPGHDLPMVMGGTFVLAFGWFGFNPGSTLAGTDLRISFIVVNTMLASATACIAAMVVMWVKFGKPDPSMMCNGMLAGLVAITAPSGFVGPIGSCIIGVVAGVVVVYSVFFFDKIGVDDCVGAISVHGTNGAWGVLSVGVFATGDYGFGYNGIVSHGVTGIMPVGAVNAAANGVTWFSATGWQQLGCQSLEVIANFICGFGIMFTFFKLCNLVLPLRVSKEVELQGLDMPEMGAMGYPDFELKTTPSTSEISSPVNA